MSDNPNPGNFANRPHEEVENIARKGGQSSHQSGFASMDPNKQVRRSTYCIYDNILTLYSMTSPRKAVKLQEEALPLETRGPERQAGKEVNHLGSLMSRVFGDSCCREWRVASTLGWETIGEDRKIYSNKFVYPWMRLLGASCLSFLMEAIDPFLDQST